MLEDLLNPVKEREISESEFHFPGGDAEIIAKVIWEFQPGGDVEAKNEGEESDREQEDTALSLGEGMELCEHLEKLCVNTAFATTIVQTEGSSSCRSSKLSAANFYQLFFQ